jgi:hypothetical protein
MGACGGEERCLQGFGWGPERRRPPGTPRRK